MLKKPIPGEKCKKVANFPIRDERLQVDLFGFDVREKDVCLWISEPMVVGVLDTLVR